MALSISDIPRDIFAEILQMANNRMVVFVNRYFYHCYRIFIENSVIANIRCEEDARKLIFPRRRVKYWVELSESVIVPWPSMVKQLIIMGSGGIEKYLPLFPNIKSLAITLPSKSESEPIDIGTLKKIDRLFLINVPIKNAQFNCSGRLCLSAPQNIDFSKCNFRGIRHICGHLHIIGSKLLLPDVCVDTTIRFGGMYSRLEDLILVTEVNNRDFYDPNDRLFPVCFTTPLNSLQTLHLESTLICDQIIAPALKTLILKKCKILSLKSFIHVENIELKKCFIEGPIYKDNLKSLTLHQIDRVIWTGNYCRDILAKSIINLVISLKSCKILQLSNIAEITMTEKNIAVETMIFGDFTTSKFDFGNICGLQNLILQSISDKLDIPFVKLKKLLICNCRSVKFRSQYIDYVSIYDCSEILFEDDFRAGKILLIDAKNKMLSKMIKYSSHIVIRGLSNGLKVDLSGVKNIGCSASVLKFINREHLSCLHVSEDLVVAKDIRSIGHLKVSEKWDEADLSGLEYIGRISHEGAGAMISKQICRQLSKIKIGEICSEHFRQLIAEQRFQS